MSIKHNRQRLIGVIAGLAVAFGFLALQYARQEPADAPGRAISQAPHEPVISSPSTDLSAELELPDDPVAKSATAAVPANEPGSTVSSTPVEREPTTYDPRYHVYVPSQHASHEYADEARFSTDTLKVYADNGDALAAFFVGTRLFWTDPESGAEYLKLATMLSGKAGPLDVLAKKYSRGQIEDLEQAYLLGYAAASIGYYRGYEEIVPKVERILWRRYDQKAAQEPDFSAEKAMTTLRARRAQIVRELNRSPLIQIDDAVDYPVVRTASQPDARDGE